MDDLATANRALFATVLDAHMQHKTSHTTASGRRLTTEELAAATSVQPASIRKRFSQTGSYHGLVPCRLPSRRLLWPADSVEQLLTGGVK